MDHVLNVLYVSFYRELQHVYVSLYRELSIS